MDNFDLRKYLTENKLTGNNKLISEIKIERDYSDLTGKRLDALIGDELMQEFTPPRMERNFVEDAKTYFPEILASHPEPVLVFFYNTWQNIEDMNSGLWDIPEMENIYLNMLDRLTVDDIMGHIEDWEQENYGNIDEIVIEPEGPSGRFTREGNNMLRNIPYGFHTVVVGPKYVDAVTYSTYYDEPSQWAEDKEELAPGSKIVYEGDDYHEALKIYNRLAH